MENAKTTQVCPGFFSSYFIQFLRTWESVMEKPTKVALVGKYYAVRWYYIALRMNYI